MRRSPGAPPRRSQGRDHGNRHRGAAGRRGRIAAPVSLADWRGGRADPARAGLRRRGPGQQRPTAAGARQLSADARRRAPGRHRLRVHSAGRPGGRALGGGLVRTHPRYFDPLEIVRLAVEGGCNAVATTLGVLGLASRRYAHHIPFIVKLNHNELLTYPPTTTRSGSPPSAKPSTWGLRG
ncbi:hypothetical protein [Blastococcus sp. TF02-8]|uniref:hypothetical protein n=1 Tax=Blastococcus sp. TF02-8 TaxID=2250574 RepID=UPI0035153732